MGKNEPKMTISLIFYESTIFLNTENKSSIKKFLLKMYFQLISDQ